MDSISCDIDIGYIIQQLWIDALYYIYRHLMTVVLDDVLGET